MLRQMHPAFRFAAEYLIWSVVWLMKATSVARRC
jgi:hypothetical protein